MEKISILIIDDSVDDRYLLKRQLKEIDIVSRIFEANDGLSGLEFLSGYEKNAALYSKDFPLMVIFLDINMPRLGGLEFLEKFCELKKLPEFKFTVLLMFTSSEAPDDQKMALNYDFVRGYIVKMPKSSQDLYEILKKAISPSGTST